MRRAGMMAVLAAMAIATPAVAATDLERTAAGMVVRGTGCIGGTDLPLKSGVIAACDRTSADLDLMFADPRAPERKGSTTSFSIMVDTDAKAMVTAYDASGRLLGVADRIDGEGDGERLSLAGLGDIARVHISGRGPIAYEDLRFAEVTTASRLPEPATWAMLICGFMLIGGVIRHRIRASEARFTAEMRRIAAGEGLAD